MCLTVQNADKNTNWAVAAGATLVHLEKPAGSTLPSDKFLAQHSLFDDDALTALASYIHVKPHKKSQPDFLVDGFLKDGTGTVCIKSVHGAVFLLSRIPPYQKPRGLVCWRSVMY